MTITNFKLDTKTLPVFIPVIQYNNSAIVSQPERHTTIYTVTLENNGTSFTKNVKLKRKTRQSQELLPLILKTEVLFIPRDIIMFIIMSGFSPQ